MNLKKSPCTVAIPPPTSSDAGFFLLEELSKPRACLDARRVTVWVYRSGTWIREVVLAGHAELYTCRAASARMIQAAKQLGEGAQWMLTAGAGYFRIGAEADDPTKITPEQIRALNADQEALQEMVRALLELAGETGLVEIICKDWEQLVDFRKHFRSRIESTSVQIVGPDADGPGHVADYLPIIPGTNPDGKVLVFTLEGWDFDCPEFQAVADLHLRKVQRELLRDALRRRHTYRVWLKEWVEPWACWLKLLTKEQATTVILDLPPPTDQPEAGVRSVDPGTFLSNHLVEFLDRDQVWHYNVAAIYQNTPFDQKSANIDLDAIFYPKSVKVIDFETGHITSRAATDEDSFIWRERILHHEPQLISTCLHYIRAMDSIIEPYQDLRLWQRVARGPAPEGGTQRDREAAVVAEI